MDGRVAHSANGGEVATHGESRQQDAHAHAHAHSHAHQSTASQSQISRPDLPRDAMERPSATSLRSVFRSNRSPSSGTLRAVTPELMEGLLPGTSAMSLDGAAPPVTSRGVSSQQSSPRGIPGGLSRRRGVVFHDSFADPTESSDSSPPSQQRWTSGSMRPRTRTMDAAMLTSRSAIIMSSESRHRVGSLSSSASGSLPLIDDHGMHSPSDVFPYPPPLPPRPPEAALAPIATKDRKSSKRLLKRESSRPSSPVHAAPPSVDSLCVPVATVDANHIVTLMRTLGGRMRGEVEYQSEPNGTWYSGLAVIEDDTGCLMFDSGQNGQFYIPIINDLRGCRVLPVDHEESGRLCLEVTAPQSAVELLICPPNCEDLDLWLAALLCWQHISPATIRLANGKPTTPIGPRRPDVAGHGKLPDDSKTTNIIKVDKVMLWDKGPTNKPKVIARRSSTRDMWSPMATWRTVSCILQDNGHFTLLFENDVVVLSMIDLAQLSRHAIQQLDRTVLHEEFCIAIFPFYINKSCRLSVFRPVYLAFDNRIHFEVWFCLLRAYAAPDIYKLNETEHEEVLDVPDIEIEEDGEIFRMEKTLMVRITEAKIKAMSSGLDYFHPEKGSKTDLDPLTGNYLAEVIVDGEVRARTTTQYATKTPFWREDCEFGDLAPSVQELSIIVKRVDGQAESPSSHTSSPSHAKSSFPQETICGVVHIALDQLGRGKDHEAWLDIRDEKQQAIGSMFLKLCHEEQVALLAKEYQPLSELLHHFPTGLTTMISTALPGQLRRLSELFLNIFQASGSASEWLMALVEDEVDGIGSQTSLKKYRFSSRLQSNESMDTAPDRELLVRDMSKSLTGEANLLFRGNTLLTQSLEFHMRRLGKEFLEELLKDKVREINDLNPDCEVDPTKLHHSGGDLDQNWTQLIRLTTEMWKCIAESASRIPAELRHILKYIRSVAEDRYGDFLRSATYTAVSGFLFLRLVCPAILSPKLFGLLRDHPRPRAQRTLTLIAKVLQKLSNLSTFGKREEYMERMNRFLTTNKTSFRDYIDQVCGIPAERGVKSVPANYSTPMTIMNRLGPSAKEGCPSLPYLIDRSRSLAGLVKLWVSSRSRDTKALQLDGDLVIFNDLCFSLQKRADACLAKVGRLRAAEAAAQGLSSPIVESLEQAALVESDNAPYGPKYLAFHLEPDRPTGSSGSDGIDDLGQHRLPNGRRGMEEFVERRASGSRHTSGTARRNGKVGRTLLSGIMKIGGRAESPDAKISR